MRFYDSLSALSLSLAYFLLLALYRFPFTSLLVVFLPHDTTEEDVFDCNENIK